MKRDQREFNAWWTLNGLESSVAYHTGLDFDCLAGEIILVDEADELILSNPAKFQAILSNHRCICLTATIDNADKEGVEREVIKHLGFKVFSGTPDFAITVSEMGMSQTLECDKNST